MSTILLLVCVRVLTDIVFPKLSTHIQMNAALKQHGPGIRIMTIKKDGINVLVPESGKKIAISFIEIIEIGMINEHCWIKRENFIIGDMENFQKFIKLNTLAGEDWSMVWKGKK